MEISNHQSKLLVLAQGDRAYSGVELLSGTYVTWQRKGEHADDGVDRFEGGDGRPLAEAVDEITWVSSVVHCWVFRGDGIVGDASALTDGRSGCHRRNKNLHSENECEKSD